MAVRIKIYFAALLLATLCGQTVSAMDRPAPRIQQSLSNQEKQARLKKFMDVCKAARIPCNEQEIREGHLELYSYLIGHSPDFRQRLWSSLSQLTWLVTLNLGRNQLLTLPKEIDSLINLERLSLDTNQLQILPEWISNLVNLKTINLTGNQLQTLPKGIGKLVNLKELFLGNNQLLDLPVEIGNLRNLTFLNLRNNQLQTLPSQVSNLESMERLSLMRCSLLLSQGDSPTNWGRQEIKDHFGDRALVDNPDIKPMPANTTLKQVYNSLDAQPLRIDRTWLQKAVLPEINAPILPGKEIIALFNTIMTQLNTKDESKSGYVSYEVLMNDYSNALQYTGKTNSQNINDHFIPRIQDFLKDLYGLRAPLDKGRAGSWQMYPAQVLQMQQALSFILTKINTAADIDTRADLMMQLANALLHCPTGQSEGLNILVSRLLKPQSSEEGVTQRITRILAVKKNSAFQNTILLKTANNPQNVHFISSYHNKLKSTLGLTSFLYGSQNKDATLGQDPFTGNPNNVLAVFYQVVTPARVVDWVMSLIKTPADIDIEHRVRKLLTLQISPSQANELVLTLTKLKNKKKCLEDPQKILLNLKEEIKTIKKESRPRWRQSKIEKFNKQISEFETLIKTIETNRNQLGTMLMLSNGKIKKNTQFRPLSPADISAYLTDNKLVNINTPNWWQGYFTADPDYEINALPAHKAIETILIHMGALKLKGK